MSLGRLVEDIRVQRCTSRIAAVLKPDLPIQELYVITFPQPGYEFWDAGVLYEFTIGVETLRARLILVKCAWSANEKIPSTRSRIIEGPVKR